MTSLVIRPHLSARSMRDLNRTVVVGAVLLLALLTPPLLGGAIVYALTRDGSWALMAGALVFHPAALLTSLSVVHWIKLDAAGLTFGRRVGTPRYRSWQRVTRISAAEPREVVRRGWLWPPFLPREATRSLTAEGHYRIDWKGGYCYYPPADDTAFREAVQRWAPGLLRNR